MREIEYNCDTVQMPGELNKLFTSFHKKLGAFKKINGLLFFRFDNCGPLERRPGANVTNAFLFNTNLLGSSGFFVIKYLM